MNNIIRNKPSSRVNCLLLNRVALHCCILISSVVLGESNIFRGVKSLWNTVILDTATSDEDIDVETILSCQNPKVTHYTTIHAADNFTVFLNVCYVIKNADGEICDYCVTVKLTLLAMTCTKDIPVPCSFSDTLMIWNHKSSRVTYIHKMGAVYP